MQLVQLPWLRSGYFHLAVAAGPIFWFSYAFLYEPYGSTADLNSQYLLLVLVYPIAEEIVFRGLLQDSLKSDKRFRTTYLGISVANLVASLTFVFVHVVLQPSILNVAVLLPSLLFGYYFDRYNTLLPGLVLHIVYNSGFFYLWPV